MQYTLQIVHVLFEIGVLNQIIFSYITLKHVAFIEAILQWFFYVKLG